VIAARLAAGDPVVLFAEGTSGDGNRVLPFRSSLIGSVQAALAQGGGTLSVQPLAIAYTGLDGLPLGRAQRHRVAWYGEMKLLPHLGEIIRRGAIDVVVTWGVPIPVAPDTDRKELAHALEMDVRLMLGNALRPVPFPSQRR
jgi:1-acyl-sn-glycerol-3-phosphate acyltransferase